MLAWLLLLAQGVAVEPRTATWDEARAVFDPAWILPSGLALAPGEDGLAFELEVELARVAALVVAPSATDPAAPRCLGDVVAAARGLDPRDLEALLARTARAQPELWRALAPCAKELLRAEKLVDPQKKWNPEKDVGNDGLLLARPLTLAGVVSAPWNELGGTRLVQQGAALVLADLETIKAAENDYTSYPGRAGTSYESIAVVAGSYLRGSDPEAGPFAALRVRFESDLPFPFGSYECELSILNRLRADGRLACDIASTSEDFYWMAGRDLYVPVYASDGTWQAELVVRLFGFDLRGVPDDDDARRTGLRSSLGSLKRDAEARFRACAGAPRSTTGSVPEFRVLSGG